jgi:ATP-dependent Lon protease
MQASLQPEKEAAPRPVLPPDAIIIVPVRNFVMFPEVVLPLTIGRPGSIAAAQAAVREQSPIGVLAQRDAELSDPAAADLHQMGTIATILRYVTAPDGAHHLIVQGQQRFRVIEFLEGWPYLVARVLRIEEPETAGPEIEARLMHLRQQALETLQLLPQAPQELAATIQKITSAAALADMVAAYLDLSPQQKQEILETIGLQERLDKVSPACRAHGGAAAEPGDRPRRSGEARKPPARGAAARADGGDPAPARRGR